MDEVEATAVVLRVDRDHPDDDAIERAADILRAGGIVAIPTETVYGLAARALDPIAVRRIFEAKGRPASNPLIVHVRGVDDARSLFASFPEAAERLAARFWPGPLTLVLPRAEHVPEIVTAGLDTVAVRAPAHAVPRALIERVGPIAAPSANRANAISPTTAQHVARSLGNRVPLILDAGPTDVGLESTVLSLASARPTILRPGTVSRRAIEEVVGDVDIADDVAHEDGARLSPGTSPRHYAPRAEVVMVGRGDRTAMKRAVEAVPRAGALVHTLDGAGAHRVERLADDPGAYGRRLYAALHALDETCERIVIENVPDDEAWRAVSDRLSRASR